MKPLSQNPSNSTPLSEQELRERISSIIFADDFPILDRDDEEALSMLVDLILQDRKAWGEYVISTDKNVYYVKGDTPIETADNFAETDRYCEIREELRNEQRQRNQGEKTDEDS